MFKDILNLTIFILMPNHIPGAELLFRTLLAMYFGEHYEGGYKYNVCGASISNITWSSEATWTVEEYMCDLT